MSVPYVVMLLKREAQRRAKHLSADMETPTTGEARLGPVVVHYFPACNQYAFWIYADKVTQAFLGKWLTTQVKNG